MPPPAILVSQVSKRYGTVRALDAVDLRVEQGEFFGLLGPNGAGKTTLISIIAGLAHADSGAVQIMGHDTARDFRAARRALGVVPQELAFDPFFTVRETLRFQSGYFGISHNDDWIDQILARLDLLAKADANMRSLSGGMKRRVLVAQALVHKPPVIVLDEPTAGVDVELRRNLWDFIRELNVAGHTIVLTTHYLEEAQALCTRLALLKAGRVIALEDTRSLLRRFSGLQMRVRLPAGLPAALAPRALGRAGDLHTLRLAAPDEIALVLATLGKAGLVPEDVEVGPVDLEDVFLQLTSDGQPA